MTTPTPRDEKLDALHEQIVASLGARYLDTLTQKDMQAIGAVSEILVPDAEAAVPSDRRIELLQQNLLKNTVPENATIGAATIMALYLNALSVRETATSGSPEHAAATAVLPMLNTVLGAMQIDVAKGEVIQDRHMALHTAYNYGLRYVDGLDNLGIGDIAPPAISMPKAQIVEKFASIARSAQQGGHAQGA